MSVEPRSIEQKINIMKAKKGGADIISKPDFHHKWEVVDNPLFNWGIADYKVLMDYDAVFGQAVNSIDYTNLSNQMLYLERGEKLQNIVDYSIDVLNKGKERIKNTLNEELPILFQDSNDITPENLKGTTALLRLKDKVYDDYFNKAHKETSEDPTLLEPYNGSFDAYFNTIYEPKINEDIINLVSELNLRIKGITSESAVRATSKIVDDSIAAIIYSQTQTPEETLYDNKAKKAEELRNDVLGVMTDAVKKYQNAPDQSYVFQTKDGISVTIRKQLEEEAPAINIDYGLGAYALHGNDCPQVGWDFDEEDKAFTITGATDEFVKINADNVQKFLDDKIHIEENSRKAEDLYLKQYIDNTFKGHLASINATYESERNERIIAQEEINKLILNMNNASEKEDEVIRDEFLKLLKDETDARLAKDEDITNKLNSEISNRQAADINLKNQITKETDDKFTNEIARTNEADQKLQEAINTESRNRSEEDGKLRSDLNTESQRATTAEQDLQSQLNSEKTTRSNEDKAINTKLTTEINRATTAEDTLTEKVTQEITNRENAISSLEIKINEEITKKLNEEVERATREDSLLNQAIQTETSSRTLACSTLQTNLSQEISTNVTTERERSTNEDKKLSDAISAETINRRSVDEAILAIINDDVKPSVTTETSRATAAETTLSENITQEVSDREKAISDLEARINDDISKQLDAEVKRATEADQQLSSAIKQEKTDRESSDTSIRNTITNTENTLNKSISDEASRAKEEEKTIKSLISAEENARSSGDSSLQSAIEAESTARSNAISSLNTALGKKLSLSGGTLTGDIHLPGKRIDGNGSDLFIGNVDNAKWLYVQDMQSQNGKWKLYSTSGNFNTEGEITAKAVHNAVWNDLTDLIIVPDNTKLEYGKCYITDGENYSFSSKYCQKGIIGIHSDTSGLSMGEAKNKTQLHIAVAGFVLAYVDKVYESGTPLTCGKNGYLTEIKMKDKIRYPERIVGTFWKSEKEKEWHGITVNNRCWIKIQ